MGLFHARETALAVRSENLGGGSGIRTFNTGTVRMLGLATTDAWNRVRRLFKAD